MFKLNLEILARILKLITGRKHLEVSLHISNTSYQLRLKDKESDIVTVFLVEEYQFSDQEPVAFVCTDALLDVIVKFKLKAIDKDLTLENLKSGKVQCSYLEDYSEVIDTCPYTSLEESEAIPDTTLVEVLRILEYLPLKWRSVSCTDRRHLYGFSEDNRSYFLYDTDKCYNHTFSNPSHLRFVWSKLPVLSGMARLDDGFQGVFQLKLSSKTVINVQIRLVEKPTDPEEKIELPALTTLPLSKNLNEQIKSFAEYQQINSSDTIFLTDSSKLTYSYFLTYIYEKQDDIRKFRLGKGMLNLEYLVADRALSFYTCLYEKVVKSGKAEEIDKVLENIVLSSLL